MTANVREMTLRFVEYSGAWFLAPVIFIGSRTEKTYHGISKVLFPLVRDRSARILPFHKPVDGKSWILEICPASLLRVLHINKIPYKGRNDTQRQNRRRILQEIERVCPIAIKKTEIRNRIVEDRGGDALDSITASMTVFNAIQNEDALIPDDAAHWKIEGHVYV